MFFIPPASYSVVVKMIELYLHIKVVCKFECPVHDTIESTEASISSTLLSEKINSL